MDHDEEGLPELLRSRRTWATFAAALLFTVATTAARDAIDAPAGLCVTDSECAELCPEGTRDLPADHPDYCDGGPQ
jgi:hypothetical protein